MYDYARPASLGTRDVIAAWLVCLAVVWRFSSIPVSPGTRAEGASRFEKRRPGGFAEPSCARVRNKSAAAPHG